MNQNQRIKYKRKHTAAFVEKWGSSPVASLLYADSYPDDQPYTGPVYSLTFRPSGGDWGIYSRSPLTCIGAIDAYEWLMAIGCRYIEVTEWNESEVAERDS